ncbi:MAG: nitroreductase family protein [Chloroflexota bacterium]|nr:nitroreductase family protein [Dehalococcoidia bacterium]MDW8252710.1 nitroreductase family protein [Chloroflexota bacterium]
MLNAIERGTVEQVIRSRRSVRRFRPDPVADAEVEALLDAARWAPSPHNSQPWRFVLVRAGETRRRLAEAMADRWRADLAAHREASEPVLQKVETRRRRLIEAPVAIVVCLTGERLDVYPDAERRAAEWLTAEHSLGAAVQNLLLTARARGLGACWICAPAFCPETVREALALPPAWAPRALILVGYPAAPAASSSRLPLADLVVVR